MTLFSWNVWALVFCFCSISVTNIFALTDKTDDRPKTIFGSHFLEGITQPFKSLSKETKQVPEWKIMKDLADRKASERAYRSALSEYGQLIRHPSHFSQIPSEEKYDIFISMSRLLKDMGFYQKAELILYEAMSYSKEPYEAHYLLGLLFLDKEDIDRSKMHLKNCLFYKESDTVILIYLSTILFTEGKTHEAKFYVSRILKILESKMSQLTSLLTGGQGGGEALTPNPEEMNHMEFIMGLEDLIVKVFHAEFLYIPSATADLFRFYFSFYQYLSRDDLKGRFVFDLGQSLYEHGKSVVGKQMMLRGWETKSDHEGKVSETVVRLRTHMDYPVVPSSVFHIIESYLNMTQYLGDINEDSTHVKIGLENAMDVSWPLPLLPWSGLPMASVTQEVMASHFNAIPVLQHPDKQLWLKNGLDVSSCFIERADVKPSLHHFKKQNKKRQSRKAKEEQKKKNKMQQQMPKEPLKVELGVLGGHFNSHAIGQVTLTRVLQRLNRLQTPNRFGYFSITLLALPLIPDKGR
jgi:tetratricopeptide (TPR) repeat protein